MKHNLYVEPVEKLFSEWPLFATFLTLNPRGPNDACGTILPVAADRSHHLPGN